MSQNTTNYPPKILGYNKYSENHTHPDPKILGYNKYSENHTHPEATVTVVLLIYYSSFFNTYCK